VGGSGLILRSEPFLISIYLYPSRRVADDQSGLPGAPTISIVDGRSLK